MFRVLEWRAEGKQAVLAHENRIPPAASVVELEVPELYFDAIPEPLPLKRHFDAEGFLPFQASDVTRVPAPTVGSKTSVRPSRSNRFAGVMSSGFISTRISLSGVVDTRPIAPPAPRPSGPSGEAVENPCLRSRHRNGRARAAGSTERERQHQH